LGLPTIETIPLLYFFFFIFSGLFCFSVFQCRYNNRRE